MAGDGWWSMDLVDGTYISWWIGLELTGRTDFQLYQFLFFSLNGLNGLNDLEILNVEIKPSQRTTTS